MWTIRFESHNISVFSNIIGTIRSINAFSLFISAENKFFVCGSCGTFKAMNLITQREILLPTDFYSGKNFIDLHCNEEYYYFSNKKFSIGIGCK